MRYLAILFALIFSACGSDPLLEPGTYDVLVTYELDRGCSTCGLEGTTDEQEWVFTEDTVEFFRGQGKYDLVQERNYLVVDKEGSSIFHMEIHPGNRREGFSGYWHTEIPGLMFTLASLEGKLQ